MSAEPPAERTIQQDAPAGEPDEAIEPLFSNGLTPILRNHPWITEIMLVCTIGGATAGPWLFEAEWPLVRQVAAGAFGGAWVGITITVTKMIGD